MEHFPFEPAQPAASIAARCLIAVVLASSISLAALQTGTPGAPQMPSRGPMLNTETHSPTATERMLAKAAEKQYAERQKQLAADTDKLLLLAQQLKTEVDASNKDTLSTAVLKKSEEIEKLARSIKNRMKNP